jgi:tellurite resistance-related uncharacterized protein
MNSSSVSTKINNKGLLPNSNYTVERILNEIEEIIEDNNMVLEYFDPMNPPEELYNIECLSSAYEIELLYNNENVYTE